MTQPTDRETAIALAKEAGMAGMLTDVVCSLEEIHRLCNLAASHSRKDAEPVAYQYRMKPEWHDAWVKWQPCDKANFDDYVKAPVINGWQFDARALFTHPPEADKPIDKLTGCACRWDENDNRVLTCVRHQGWLDVVEEWATTAKENQVVIDRLDGACTEQHAAYTSAHSRLNEADKLLQQALEALEYRLQQTRPIHQADSVMEAIRTYLENKA